MTGLTEPASFDLLTRPWIPVQTAGGERRELGLIETLTRAHELRWIEPDSDMEGVALHRFLLAVAHRALGGPRDHDQWAQWWRAGRLDGETIASYLEAHADRFDLWHPAHPFAQTPGLQSNMLGADKVTAYAGRGAGPGWFTPIPRELEEAQAARWLLWCHAYDTGGIRAKHGGGRAMGTPSGHAGWSAQIRVSGQTLAETLLLSMAPYEPPGTDAGWWERNDPADRRRNLIPAGLVHILTWSSRRVLLHRDDDGMVRRVQICAGDDAKRLPGDPLTARPWPVGASVSHLTAGGLAELLGAELPDLRGDEAKADAETPEQPGLLTALGERVAAGHLSEQRRVLVTVTGVAHDKYRAVFEDAGHCQFAVMAGAFAAGSLLHQRAAWTAEALHRAESAVRRATGSAFRAAAPAPPQQHLARLADVVRQLRFALDAPTRYALSGLHDEAALERFTGHVQQITTGYLDEATDLAISRRLA